MNRTLTLAALALAALLPLACASDYKDSGGDPNSRGNEFKAEAREAEAMQTIERFKAKDPSIVRFFTNAHGYVVFPEITKGGLVVGGAHGHGTVFEQGVAIGFSEMSQGTVGAQIGGQKYAEVIFFKDKAALDHFKLGNAEFAAQAAGVVAETGASANADFENGVAIFAMPLVGAMGEASVGGQKFTYNAKP